MTTTEDGGDGKCDDTCTLRDAVIEAGQRGDGPTIFLKAETYSLTQGELVLGGAFTIEGVGSRATTITSNREGRVAYVASRADIIVNDLTVTGGSAFSEAQDGNLGGGFRVASEAKLALSRTTVTGNVAASAGGGISSAGALHVEQSTVSFNVAEGAGPAGRGGGIHLDPSGGVVLLSSTLSGNAAFPGIVGDPGQGGGIYTAGSFSMEHVTIAQNDAAAGGGLYQARSTEGAMSIWNTLFARNTDDACGGTLGIIEESHNLADDPSCALDQVGDREDAFPGIMELNDHGGPTDTHALDIESEAIDAATTDHCPPFDQRSFGRPASDACDIGAVERRLDPVVNTTVDGNDGACAPEPGGCTLRDALTDSERDAVIMLQEGEYEVTFGELQLRGHRRIVGQNARRTTIRASGAHRVLSVLDGDAAVFDVRITGGDVVNGQGLDGDVGGGILVLPEAALNVVGSTVEGNRAAAGGGIANKGFLIVESSTIASNEAISQQAGGPSGTGGGLLTDFEAFSSLVNSTVSGNTASTAGGGIANLGGTLATFSVTIADNQTPTPMGGGVYGDIVEVDGVDVGETRMTNTMVATNAGGACSWTPEHDRFADHSLADDGSCFEPGDGNLVDPDPRIGALDSRFGSTDVHALLEGSPAIDAGNDELCAWIDQRGEERIGRCDIGAFEAAATLRVVTQVINDNGGTVGPASFNVHVRSGGADVAGSPRAGSGTGSAYRLAAGTYTVRADSVAGYVLSVGKDCDGDATVTLALGQEKACTVTANDDPPPPATANQAQQQQQQQQQQQPNEEQLPPPEAGETVNALPATGTVKIRLQGTKKFVELKEGQQIPVGTVIDTTKGRVTLVAASDKSGGTATADFYAGIFKIGQTKGAKPTSTLELVEKLACGRGQASAAAKRKKKRRLWGDGSGRFRTDGEYSSATVRGTKWLVEDQCKTTLTKVTRGKVAVRDFVKRKTVIVRAGKQYLARARR